MWVYRYFLVWIVILLLPAAGWTETEIKPTHKVAFSYPETIKRYYLNFNIEGFSIQLEGSPAQIKRLQTWLDEIVKVPIGRSALVAIANSGNQLTIRHSDSALMASGRTLAPLSRNLTNNLGEDTEILFDTRIPVEGSHWVFDAKSQKMAFTSSQNLFHELAHAKHLMNGTWRYFDSEGQAIEEENIFRLQQNELSGKQETRTRVGIKGLQYWWPGSGETKVVVKKLNLESTEPQLNGQIQ